jgi:hypothetical protein
VFVAGPPPDRLVSGVPAALSIGGAAGLPDLPREGRGRGVVSRSDVGERENARVREADASSRVPGLGGRGMGDIWRAQRRGSSGVRRRSVLRLTACL